MLRFYVVRHDYSTHITLCYYRHAQRHRKDGPDVIAEELYQYHQYGKIHRDDGPALMVKNSHHLYARYGKTYRTT